MAEVTPLLFDRPLRVLPFADFAIIGSGITGLHSAMHLPRESTVRIFTKQSLENSSSSYAQGGVAAVLSEEDRLALHVRDTINAGDGLCLPERVELLVTEGVGRVRELIAGGMVFDQRGGRLIFTREAAHSRHRILHAGGDSTGKVLENTLIGWTRERTNISLFENSPLIDIFPAIGGNPAWALFLDSAGEGFVFQPCRAMLLATGGAGQIFPFTTNPSVATGDGIGAAWRAGGALVDMEFMQFHPTAFAGEGESFLISEAVRGEGATLLNRAGERFLKNELPQEMELASRDKVSLAIARELRKSGEKSIFIDFRTLTSAHPEERFPFIFQKCRERGLDPMVSPIPVAPAAHYLMGGIWSGESGETGLPGIFSAGENSCTGVHGANRLASNSLLECLVFGTRAAGVMGAIFDPARVPQGPPPELATHYRKGLQQSLGCAFHQFRAIMGNNLGIERGETGIRAALAFIDGARERFSQALPLDLFTLEFRNLLDVGRAMALSALTRRESRGAHYRADCPSRTEEFAGCHHFYLARDGVGEVISSRRFIPPAR